LYGVKEPAVWGKNPIMPGKKPIAWGKIADVPAPEPCSFVVVFFYGGSLTAHCSLFVVYLIEI
jgi:hypothetical protein